MPTPSLIRKLSRQGWNRVAAAICWERTDESVVHYDEWPAQKKDDLAQALGRILAGQTLGLPAAPALSVNFASTATAETCLSPGMAWRYFIGHVAQSLAFECRLDAEANPSWSLKAFSRDALALLFDSRSLFKWYPVFQAYTIDPGGDLGAATPGDPVRTFRFLQHDGLLGASRRRTIDAVLAWCRSHLVHYGGSDDVANVVDYWQYAGMPPVESMIAGTLQSSQPTAPSRHWTKGCSGTAGFLRAVLRTANIPVAQLRVAGHALVHFVREGLFLSHGDDPYGGLAEATPPIPIGELPITRATFDAWFGPQVAPPDAMKNVGRQVLELAIEHLPNLLLRYHCHDLSQGSSHASSTVFTSIFQNSPFTVSDLEAAQLWQRMDVKLAQLGGCAHVPPVTYGT